MSGSPTARTKELLEGFGFRVAITEHWNQWAHIRQDLFGFIDLVALGTGKVIGVQTTTASHRASRREKILALDNARRWCQAGAYIWLITWSKRGPRKKWDYRIEWIVPHEEEKEAANIEDYEPEKATGNLRRRL